MHADAHIHNGGTDTCVGVDLGPVMADDIVLARGLAVVAEDDVHARIRIQPTIEQVGAPQRGGCGAPDCGWSGLPLRLIRVDSVRLSVLLLKAYDSSCNYTLRLILVRRWRCSGALLRMQLLRIVELWIHHLLEGLTTLTCGESDNK